METSLSVNKCAVRRLNALKCLARRIRVSESSPVSENGEFNPNFSSADMPSVANYDDWVRKSSTVYFTISCHWELLQNHHRRRYHTMRQLLTTSFQNLFGLYGHTDGNRHFSRSESERPSCREPHVELFRNFSRTLEMFKM